MNKLLLTVFLVIIGVSINTFSRGEEEYAYMSETIAIKGYNGQYLCAENGGDDIVIMNRDKCGDWETFEITYLDDNYIALKTSNGQYITAEGGGGGEVSANRPIIGEWEQFRLLSLSNNKVAFETFDGHYLCADLQYSNLLVADRSVIGLWETFEIIKLGVDHNDIDYNIEIGNEINSDRFCRITATDNFLYAGTYARKNDRDGRAWILKSGDGLNFDKVDFVDNVESLHTMFTGPSGKNINVGTEHRSAVYSLWDDNYRLRREFIFSNRGGVKVIIGSGDGGEFGELMAESIFDGNPVIAGYVDGSWIENIYPTIPNKFIWKFVNFKGNLLAGCSYASQFNHKYSGSIYRLSEDRSKWDLVVDPPWGICKGLMVYDGVLYAMFGKALLWTEDLMYWKEVEMPGVHCFNLAKVSDDRFISIWYTPKRQRVMNGYEEGIWLVEFNPNTEKIKILKHWVTIDKNGPYWIGGGVVNFKGHIAGFFTINGVSRGMKITW